ncbi:MAG TPA: recombinase family protein [Thermomicrobiaceae bacterium]|nr:recombinase family protein [Thermomicrobiaceae bacterium]
MAIRAAIYTWYRGDEADDPEQNNAVQEERCRAYAEASGYQIVRTFNERTLEMTDDRPELRALRALIWSRRVDLVLAANPSRLYLDADRLQRFNSETRELGARLEFLESPNVLDFM